jgi:DNA repair photolyase
LGFNAGLDFETKIVVKHDAPELLREVLAKDSWKPEPIMFSGVTDCYQPAERQFQLTRRCLELALECKHPVSIITKNALVIRDLDIL